MTLHPSLLASPSRRLLLAAALTLAPALIGGCDSLDAYPVPALSLPPVQPPPANVSSECHVVPPAAPGGQYQQVCTRTVNGRRF